MKSLVKISTLYGWEWREEREVGKVDIYESKAAYEIFMEILRHFNDVNISWNGEKCRETSSNAFFMLIANFFSHGDGSDIREQIYC